MSAILRCHRPDGTLGYAVVRNSVRLAPARATLAEAEADLAHLTAAQPTFTLIPTRRSQ